MVAIRKDGRVPVIDKTTGKEVWLYPVDAREGVAIGSHTWVPGKEIRAKESAEVEAMRKRLAELEAKVGAEAPTAPAPSAPAATAQSGVAWPPPSVKPTAKN